MKKRYALAAVLLLVLYLPLNSFSQTIGWDFCNNSGLLMPANNRFDDIYFFNKDTGVVVAAYGQIFKTTDGGANWQGKYFGPGSSYFRSVEFSDNHQYGIAGALDGNVMRSADRGETWSVISFNITDTGLAPRRLCGLAHWGNNTFYGVGWWGATVARFYKSTDSGQTWTTSYLDTNLASGLVDIICLSADTLFASGCRLYDHGGGSRRESVVLRSVNGGQSWTRVFSDTTLGGRIWKLQAVDHQYIVGSIEPEYADTVAMIKSKNGGVNWQILPAGSRPSQAWGTQGIGFINKQKGWLGGYYDGLFETNDSGATWTPVFNNESWGNRFFKADDTTMYLSGNAVYKYSDSVHHPGLGVATPHVHKHKLYTVSPNPASGKITIRIDITERTNTLIEVVSIEGRKVYPVMNGYLEPGHYTYTWDGTGLPRGNYIVWMGTDVSPVVQKFTLY